MKLLLLLCCIVLLSVSCKKDLMKGNTDYKDLNKVLMDANQTLFTTQETKTYHIAPKFIQSLNNDDISNLSFEWRVSTVGFAAANLEAVVSTAQFFDQSIVAGGKDFVYYYRLYVTDKTTGVRYPADIKLVIGKAYKDSWMVLHNVGNTARLGTVEFLYDRESSYSTRVDPDAFSSNNAAPLSGMGIALGYMSYTRYSWEPVTTITSPDYTNNQLYIITDDANSSASYSQWMKFLKMRPIADMPQQKDLITSDKLSKTSYFYGMDTRMIAVMDGKLFNGGNGLKLYQSGINRSSKMINEPYLKYALKVGYVGIFYDSKNRCFLYYDSYSDGTAPSSGTSFSFTPTNYSSVESRSKLSDMDHANTVEFNPVPADREVVYIGTGAYGAATGQSKSFALAIGTGDQSKLYAYQFTRSDYYARSANSTLESIRTFNLPIGLNEKSQFASTASYNGIAFYSSESRIYKLDYTTGKSSLIYDHGKGNIQKMKFARPEILQFDNLPETTEYGVNPRTSLGVLVNDGANSELVVLNLSETGLISGTADKRPGTEVFKGFGTGVDIMFY